MRSVGSRLISAALTGFACLALPAAAHAQSIEQTLIQAYRNNPDLNAARAGVRVANEGVPAALSGYRPSVNATVTAAGQYSELASGSILGAPGTDRQLRTMPRSASITAT